MSRYPRCALCTFPSPTTPCEVCASGAPMIHLDKEALLAQLAAAQSPGQGTQPREGRPMPTAPCGGCGTAITLSYGRTTALSKGFSIYCDSCKKARAAVASAAAQRRYQHKKKALRHVLQGGEER